MDNLQNMETYEKVVYRGISTGENDIYEEIKKAIGVDIRNNPNYRIGSPGAEDDFGISETVYSEFYVYKIFSIRPETPEIDPIPPHIPHIPTTEDNEKIIEEKKQDMLDKYYGNIAKEKEYKKRMKRFKSHIIEKTDEGIKYKTVENYPEREKDAEFLQLEEFAYKLERLTRAQSGDFSMYKEIAENFVNATSVEATKDDKEKLEKQSINVLMKADADYIETNNYAYNQHQSTQENLKTLGKYGEKVPFIKIIPIKKGEKGMAKKVIKNVGIVSYNTFLLGRNYVLVPIDKAIGTFIAAPVHKLLYNSEKNTAGIYKNKTTHRYTARRVYFEKQYLLELEKENKKLKEEKQELKRPSIYKLVFKPRLDAIFKSKEGNIAVLTAGANDIEKSVIQISEVRIRKELRIRTLEKVRSQLLDNLEEIEQEIKVTKDDKEKLKLEILLQKGVERLLELDEKIENTIKSNVDSVIQTDAVSMAEHDITNKSNITKVVSGVKMIARATLMKWIGKNISKYVSEKITKKEWVEEQVITQEKIVPGKFDQESLESIKISDLVKNTKHGNVSYHGGGGNIVNKPGNSHLRGIFGPDFNGDKVSGSDGLGFDIIGRTDVKITPMTDDSKLFDVLAETISNSKGSPVTSKELIDQITSAADPQSTFETILKETRIWVSTHDTGMPTGWLDVSDGVKAISENIVKDKIIKTTTVIPGHYITVVDTAMRKVIDGRMVAAEMVLAAGGARDLYELLRRTKTKEEMVKEGTHTKKLESFQKDNKPEFTERNYEGNKWGFVGTRKGDFASDYDENSMGKGRKK